MECHKTVAVERKLVSEIILWGVATGIIEKEIKNNKCSRLKSVSETENLVLAFQGNLRERKLNTNKHNIN